MSDCAGSSQEKELAVYHLAWYARVFSVLKCVLRAVMCVEVKSSHLSCFCHCGCAGRLLETSSCHLYSTCVFARLCSTSHPRSECVYMLFSPLISAFKCAFVRVTVVSWGKQSDCTLRISPRSFKRRGAMQPNKRKQACPRALTARIWIWICAGRQQK